MDVDRGQAVFDLSKEGAKRPDGARYGRVSKENRAGVCDESPMDVILLPAPLNRLRSPWTWICQAVSFSSKL